MSTLYRARVTRSERVVAYVDGYNLYYGLISKQWRRYLWLNLRALFERELLPSQQLVGIDYFTARGRSQDPGSNARQDLFLQALRYEADVDVHEVGVFRQRPWKCSQCSTTTRRPHEKQTDVAIAVAIVADAYSDRYDTAWLMCSDADLVPSVAHVVQRFSSKRVIVVPPRGRRSDELIAAATGKRDINRARFAQAQFPDRIVLAGGAVIERPQEWR